MPTIVVDRVRQVALVYDAVTGALTSVLTANSSIHVDIVDNVAQVSGSVVAGVVTLPVGIQRTIPVVAHDPRLTIQSS